MAVQINGKHQILVLIDHTNSPCTINTLFSLKMVRSSSPNTVVVWKQRDDVETMDDAVDFRFSNESLSIDSGGESEKFKQRRIDAAWAPVGVELACRSVLWMPGVLSYEIFDVIDVMAHGGTIFELLSSGWPSIGVGVFMHANSSMDFLKNDVRKISASVGVTGLDASFVCSVAGSSVILGDTSLICNGSVFVCFRRTAFCRRKWQLPAFSPFDCFAVSSVSDFSITSGVRTSRSLITSMSSMMMVRSAAQIIFCGDIRNLSQNRLRSLAGSSAAVYVGDPKFGLNAWFELLLFREVRLRTNEVFSFFPLSMMASIQRSSAVSFNADELSDSSVTNGVGTTLLLLLLFFSFFDFCDFFNRFELRFRLILLNRMSENRVDSGVAPTGGEYFSFFDTGGAGISSSSLCKYRGFLK